MVRFPHILSYTSPAIEGHFNENGDWVPGTEGTEVSEPCRAEPNLKAGYIINEADGSRIEFSFVVHLSKDVNPIPTGKVVTIKNRETSIFQGDLKRFHKGQLHSRLWV